MRTLLAVALLAALTVPVTGAQALLPQDDAGSGTDAPETPTASFRIDPGVVYTGHIEGKTGGDSEDWYAFDVQAGAVVNARAASAAGCLGIHDPSGAELDVVCAIGYAELGPARAVAAAAGTYYLRFNHTQPTIQDAAPQAYRFALGIDAPAPAPAGVPVTVADLLPGPGGVPAVAPATQAGEHVVVAVVDSGINPYHDFFAAPALADHPSTWLPGFPAAATSVGLTLDEPDHAAANAADDAAWAGLRTSTYNAADDSYDSARLYTFPGTRVIGGISFGEYVDLTAAPTTGAPAVPRPVRDDHGHGTHSAGLAAGANLAAADGNVLVVAVEVGQGAFEDGIRWAARQPWIDAVTVSLGSRGNVPGTDGARGADKATREAHLAGKPVFMASGNGFSNSGVTPDRCTTYTSEYTGPGWVTRIGAAKERNGNPSWWHCVPVEAIAKTDVNSPSFDSTTLADPAGGTSASTPNAAGHYARLLLDGRRAGSTATRLATLDHLLHAAAPAAPAVGANEPGVYPATIASQGYGLIDAAALDAATARLLAGAGPAPRPETQTWFAADAAIRDALWGSGSPTDLDHVPTVAQDDAGSGADAPPGPSRRAPRIEPGVRYEGMIDGVADGADWYAFDGTAGETLSFALSGAGVCYDVVSPSGTVVQHHCSGGYAQVAAGSATLGETGTWHFAVSYLLPQTYSFGFQVGGAPPPVFP